MEYTTELLTTPMIDFPDFVGWTALTRSHGLSSRHRPPYLLTIRVRDADGDAVADASVTVEIEQERPYLWISPGARVPISPARGSRAAVVTDGEGTAVFAVSTSWAIGRGTVRIRVTGGGVEHELETAFAVGRTPSRRWGASEHAAARQSVTQRRDSLAVR